MAQKFWLMSEELMQNRAEGDGNVVLLLIVLEKEVASRTRSVRYQFLINEEFRQDRLSTAGVSGDP